MLNLIVSAYGVSEDTIAGGSAIFAYYPDRDWLQQSHYLHCDQVAEAGNPG